MHRGVSTVAGVLLVTALTVAVAGAAGVVALGLSPEPSPRLPVELSASASAVEKGVRIEIRHESGPTIDVREVTLRIAVNGTPLPHQPDVPFYGLTGYASFPSGPFNPSADPRWELGESASLTVTDGNAARFAQGARVRVELYRDDLPLGIAETTVR